MKQLTLLMALFMGLSTFSMAQAKKKSLETATISVPTVQCEMCKKKIESTLARAEGVTKATVDYKKKKAKVSFWTDRTNIENIKTVIANAGYDADDVTAEPDAYNRLPKCCKKKS